jgi:Biotin/lipoate A/B protein ligase family
LGGALRTQDKQSGAALKGDLSSPEIFGAGDGGDALDLPPGFELVALREGGDAFAYAQEIAARRGAGTLVWVKRFDLVEFAVVLEPEEPLVSARRAFYVGMNAMADSLAVHCPPEKPIHFGWPDSMTFDHGMIGGGRLAWPRDAAEDQPPEWLVFAGMMRTAVIRDKASGVSLEPGTWSIGTALEVEGFEGIDAGQLVESFCRHLMVHVDAWIERGFRKVGREWLARLPEDKGLKRGIDGNGDLLTHAIGQEGAARREDFVTALAKAAWFDPETREPRL